MLERWRDQEAEKRQAALARYRAERESAVALWMDEMGDLTGWALEQWARDKAAGYGRAEHEDQAVIYTLGSLGLAVAKVQSVQEYVARRDGKEPTP